MKKSLLLYFVLLSLLISVSAQDVLIPYRIKNKWGFSDSEGNIKVTPAYDSVDFFSSRILGNLGTVAKVTLNNKKGLIDENGKLIIPTIYQDIEIGNSRFSFVNCFIVKNKGKYGAVDIDNKQLLPIIYDSILIKVNYDKTEYYSEFLGFIFAIKEKGEYYYLNKKNKERAKLSKDEFEKIENEESNSYEDTPPPSQLDLEKLKNSKTAILKANTKIIDDFDTVSIKATEWDNPYFVVYKAGKLGLATFDEFKKDSILKIFIPIIHDKLLSYNKSFLLQKGKEKLWYNNRGKFMATLIDEDVFEMGHYHLITKKEGKLGLISNISRKTNVVNPKYNSLKEIKEYDLWLVELNGKKGYINSSGFEYFSD